MLIENSWAAGWNDNTIGRCYLHRDGLLDNYPDVYEFGVVEFLRRHKANQLYKHYPLDH